MDTSSKAFADKAIRRERLFWVLAWVGVAIGVLYGISVAYRYWRDPSTEVAIRSVVVLLILLNARQNLRQYKYARVLRDLMGPSETQQSTENDEQ